jgi:hypothetical protein
MTLSGIEKVVGSGANDYIKVNSTGMTVDGGVGDDTFVLGSGSDTVKFTGSTDAANGEDTIGTFQTGDVLDFSAVLSSGALANATTSTTITLATTTALATEGTGIDVSANEVYVMEVALKAGIDTVADLVTALANTGVADAVDVAVSSEVIIVVGGADDDTTHYVYGINNNATAAVIAGEVALLGVITGDITNGIAGLLTTNFSF